MSFAPIRPGGFADGTRLYGTELTTFDENMTYALDTRGGTYVMTAPIIFTGDEWTLPDTVVDGVFIVTGDVTLGVYGVTSTTLLHGDVLISDSLSIAPGATLTVNGSVSLGGAGQTLTVLSDTATFSNAVVLGSSSADALTVNATPTFNAATTFASTTSFVGAAAFNAAATFATTIAVSGQSNLTTLQVSGSTTLLGTAGFFGNATFNEDVTIGSTDGTDAFTVNSPATFVRSVSALNMAVSGTTTTQTLIVNGISTINGHVDLNSDITAWSGSSIPKRVHVWAADADYHPTWSTANVIIVPDGILSVTREATPNRSAPDGSIFEYRCYEATAGVGVRVEIDYPTAGASVVGSTAGTYISLRVVVVDGEIHYLDGRLLE